MKQSNNQNHTPDQNDASATLDAQDDASTKKANGVAGEQMSAAEIMEQLAKENAEKDAKIAELINDAQRTRADFENFRRQTELQKEQYGKIVKESTVKKILPLIDDIDRAIVAQPEQLAPLAKNLEKTLKAVGLSRIEAKPGTIFNPDLHDAIQAEGDGDKEEIAVELQAGYYYESEVIRPSLVKVIKK